MKITKKNVFFDEENCFSYQKLKCTPADYAPIYTWCWSIPLDAKTTEKDLEEFVRLGIRTVYILPLAENFRPKSIPSTMDCEYLGKDYMDHYAYAIKKAKEFGIQAWLYDESGWPSGGAGGKIVADKPEYGRHKLDFCEKQYKAGDVYRATDGHTAFCNDEFLIEDGYVFAEDQTVSEYYCVVDITDPAESADIADVTNREAVAYFIKLTHEAYKNYIGDEMGKGIKAVFTDEPTMPKPTPFSKTLEEDFEKEKGYSIRPYLPILARKRTYQTATEREAMIDWYDYISRAFCENFMKPCKSWSNNHGMAFLGHMDLDDMPHGSVLGGNGNIMRALRHFDVPGIDAIWRQIFPMEMYEESAWRKFGENRFFPRYASSAAAQIGGRRAVTETFGVYGMGLTFDQMRYVLTFQAVRGINMFNFMLVPYGDPTGCQMTGELPAFKEKYACYADLGTFNKYVERLSYMTSVGKNVADVALYLPIKDFYGKFWEKSSEVDEFDRIGFGLEDKQIPFDIFDDDVLEAADPEAIAKGCIGMGDASYRTLIITDCQYMSAKAEKAIRNFIFNGGRVICTKEYIAKKLEGSILSRDVWDVLNAPIQFAGDTKGIRLMHRVSDNSDMYYISNEAFEEKDVTVFVKEDALLVDLTNDRILKPDTEENTWKITLLSGEMVIILYTDAQVELAQKWSSQQKITLNADYSIRKTKQFIIGDNTSFSADIIDEERCVTLGDWCNVVGKSFSGSCVYKTSFTVHDISAPLVLDLGEVCYSCEVFINGKSLGVRVMKPYTFVIPAEMLMEENTLEVRVSNTAANEFYFTDKFDKYEPWKLTSYHKITQSFHKESLKGGLFGPVRLWSSAD